MWQNKSVSVVFPAYNEEENIGAAIEDFFETGVVDELIVVDNNSTDRTASIAKKQGAKVVKEKKQGYGFALQAGMKAAKSQLVILAEPDGTFVGKDILKLLLHSKNFDLVLGTRTNKKFIKKAANMGFFLRWGNILLAKFLQTLFQTPSISDCGCTLRLIRRQILKKILPKFTVGGGHFLPEMIILANQNGAKIIEVPVNYRPRIGTSKITGNLAKAVKVGLAMFFLILKYRSKMK